MLVHTYIRNCRLYADTMNIVQYSTQMYIHGANMVLLKVVLYGQYSPHTDSHSCINCGSMYVCANVLQVPRCTYVHMYYYIGTSMYSMYQHTAVYITFMYNYVISLLLGRL